MHESFNLDPPPGFHGLDPDKPIHYYFRHLPHWRQDGASYFITFRTADSLPKTRLDELKCLRDQFKIRFGDSPPKEQAKIFARQILARIEKWLDFGTGQCHLKQSPYQEEVAGAMHFFDGKRYELDCFVVMPNHVHAIAKPMHPKIQPLEKILQSWKRHSSNKINKHLRIDGSFWQQESYDRIIRDEEHLYQAIQYIGNNPRLANLPERQSVRWIKPEWDLIGWGFREPTS